VTPKISYFICTLPRSGSWLLSESLEKTHIAGRPREYFEPKLFENHSGDVYSQAFERIIRRGMTKNGVFGVKFHWYQFEYTPRLIVTTKGDADVPIPLLMSERFPNLRYIWLTRRDKARQAISYFRAGKTGQWWRIPGVNAEDRPGTVEFDFNRIQYLERLLINHEAKWQKYFEEHNIDPLVVVYEEFAENLAPVVAEILRYLKIPCPKRTDIRPRLQRQSDSLTEEWVERYAAMKRACAIGL